jgi:hypothetical protein
VIHISTTHLVHSIATFRTELHVIYNYILAVESEASTPVTPKPTLDTILNQFYSTEKNLWYPLSELQNGFGSDSKERDRYLLLSGKEPRTFST